MWEELGLVQSKANMWEELGLMLSKASTSCGASLDGVMEVKFLSWLTSKLCIVDKGN